MNPVRPICSIRHYNLNEGKGSVSNEIWFYTYVLRCEKTGTFYTGTTDNLEKRLEQHNKGKAFYTKSRLPVELVYFEGCLSKDNAYRREHYLKTGMGKRYLKNRLSPVRNTKLLQENKISNGVKGTLQQAVTSQGGLTG